MSFGLTHQNTFWKDRYGEIAFSNLESRVLPSAKIEWPLNEIKTIKLTYNQTAGNPDTHSRLRNKKVEDFNRVFLGNPELEQFINNRLLLTYSSRRAYGWSIYANAGYREISRQIVNANTFSGIFGQITPVQLASGNKGLDFVMRVKYNKRYWNVSATNRFYYNEVLTLLNNQISQTISRSFNPTVHFATNYENYPNIELDLKNSLFFNQNPLFSNRTTISDIDLSLNYQVQSWKFDFAFLQTYYRNQSQASNADFGQINGNIFYRKEDSLWEFGVSFYNLANNQFKTVNSFNLTRFNESTISVFPRTILLNINYKL